MKKLTLALLAFALVAASTEAVSQVKNNSFRLMLKTLLSHSVPETTVEKAAADSTAIFLDAREKREFEVSHLPGAIWVGYDGFQLENVAQLARNQRIIVYCSVGYRSEKVSEKLLAAGFSEVSNLVGGIFEWANEGEKVIDETGPTERVHAFSRIWGIWLKRGKKVYK